ncbi:NTP transferase domain-containing protein [Aliiruegeria sabulilitoris]|uniref:NTP transferase domain-containing protein n=1 Tax=Aliiruegeria sabulilitoris TaxID=1510458 RepID=UPI0009EA05A7|nr:NTP transferase domain-containing protein [Aliiruegeria sabulilitoris]NDR56622.1 capsular biosynthesis protein [Pseudoruegeria sp. M32A2M]
MIAIPMAGLSSRFFEAGFNVPKYMLSLHGRPVFDYALSSFRNQFHDQEFLIVCRRYYGTPDFVLERCSALGIRRFQLVVLEEETSGQAETVNKGLDAANVKTHEPLTIFNIDSFRRNFRYPFDSPNTSSFLEVFYGDGDHWSFVLPSRNETCESAEDGCVKGVTEKERISDLCSNGLYHFASVKDYRYALEAEKEEPTQALSESYIAPVYNHLIKRGDEVRYRIVPTGDLVFCGIPEEYYRAQRSKVLKQQFWES